MSRIPAHTPGWRSIWRQHSLRTVPVCALLLVSCAKADDRFRNAQSAIEPIFKAFARAQIENAADKSASLGARLLALGRVDAAGRDVMERTDLSRLPPAQRQIAADAAWAEIRLHDRDDQRTLETLMPQRGWFDQRVVGVEAARSAWLVVQHATNNGALMTDVLARMKADLGTGKLRDADYAELLDRVQMEQHRPQTYGTQFVCQQNHWRPYALLDPSGVEARRHAVGIEGSLVQDIRDFAAMPPCIVPGG